VCERFAPRINQGRQLVTVRGCGDAFPRWRANFSGDSVAGVPASSDSSASECFVIKPRPTMLVTQGNGTVPFGQPVTDTATPTNTANQPGTGGGGTNGSIDPTTPGGPADGTITFTLYKSCGPPLVQATGSGTNPQSVPVNGDGTYGPVSFTPDAPGTYFWVATYNGDSPNTLASGSPACGVDPNETIVVEQIPTAVKTKQSWFPNDTATISARSGNLAAGGTVEFSLYTNATCSGEAVFSQSRTFAGGSPTEEVSTNNTTYQITTGYNDPADSNVGRHSWKVVYTPAAGDTAHTGSQSSCDAEHFNITYTNDPGPPTP
jgi:hypothetical protein